MASAEALCRPEPRRGLDHRLHAGGQCAALARGGVWRQCGGSVAAVWRQRGGSVAVVWRQRGGSVAAVWR